MTPLEEASERAAETIPGLKAAAAAVGLEDHRRMLRDSARRVADSHRAQMSALGMSPEVEDDEMGNIVITGDINGANAKEIIDALSGQRADTSATQPPQTNPQEKGGIGKTLAVAGLAGLMAGAGAGVPLAWYLMNQQPAAQDTDTNTKYGLKIFREPQQ